MKIATPVTQIIDAARNAVNVAQNAKSGHLMPKAHADLMYAATVLQDKRMRHAGNLMRDSVLARAQDELRALSKTYAPMDYTIELELA